MQYQYQVDYGNGYEDDFLNEQEAMPGGEENPSQWLAGIETDFTAERARVLLGDTIVEEREFTCTVSQNSVQPNGSAEYSVQCSGGNITVERKSGGELTGYAEPGYAGDADLALERAFEAVRKLNEI